MQTLRKELKFVISEEVYLKLRKKLEAMMYVDEYCKNGSYMVRSQYYDSLTDADLFDNISGVAEKRKIRIRIYSTNDEAAKLEYKCKSGSDGTKYSILITNDEVALMEAHRYDFLLEKNERLALYLYTKLTGQVYRPKTIVEYDREAYSFPAGNVRITYDRNVRGTINPYGLYAEDLMYVPLLKEAYGVLEIKYSDYFPTVLMPMVDLMDSVAEAYSKYSNSRMVYM